MPFVTADFVPTDTLDDTQRGQGGYGSTGGFTRPDEDVKDMQ